MVLGLGSKQLLGGPKSDSRTEISKVQEGKTPDCAPVPEWNQGVQE
jgi:hypothetical protein